MVKKVRIVPMIALYEVMFQRRGFHCMRHLIFHPVSVLNLGVWFFSACLQTQPFKKGEISPYGISKNTAILATWKRSNGDVGRSNPGVGKGSSSQHLVANPSLSFVGCSGLWKNCACIGLDCHGCLCES